MSAAIVAVVGSALVLTGVGFFVFLVPVLLGSQGEHMAGDAGAWLAIAVLPIGLGGILSLLLARSLWRSGPGSRAWLVAWIALAACVCVLAWQAEGNLLSTLRRVITLHGSIAIQGTEVGASSPTDATYYGRLDDPTFWLPAVLAVAVIALAAIQVAWRRIDRI
jgi:hypothetical protein